MLPCVMLVVALACRVALANKLIVGLRREGKMAAAVVTAGRRKRGRCSCNYGLE